jgi:hypothetical protein
MKTEIRNLFYKAAHRLGLRKDPYPQIIALDVIPSQICRFEVTNRYESGRVKAANIEKEFLTLLLAKLNSADVFFDIGAGIGLFSIYAATVARCQVVSFEPDPEIRSRLMRNFTLNNLSAFEMWAGNRQALNKPPHPSHQIPSPNRPVKLSITIAATLFSDGIRGNHPVFLKHGLSIPSPSS